MLLNSSHVGHFVKTMGLCIDYNDVQGWKMASSGNLFLAYVFFSLLARLMKLEIIAFKLLSRLVIVIKLSGVQFGL